MTTHHNRNILGSAFVLLVGVSGASVAQTANTKAPKPDTARRAPTTTQPAPSTQPQAADCPEFVRGSKLEVSNIEGGVQIKLTAGQAGYVDSLRKMSREVAEFVDQHERTGAVQQSSNDMQVFPPVTIDVKNITAGTVVTVHADSASNIPEVRQQAHNLEALWRTSECVGAPSRSQTTPQTTPK